MKMQEKLKTINIRLNCDWLLGVLTAIPFAYPKEPLYWLGLIALLIVSLRIRYDRQLRDSALLIYFFSGVIIFINMTSSYSEYIYPFSIAGTIFTLLFFMFRFGVRDYESFINGYLLVIKIYVVLVFIYFFSLKPYINGFGFFINSNSRMWAEGYLIEWPNVFCVMLVMGVWLFWFKRSTAWFWITMLAAILTTSRMALLCLLIFIIFTIFEKFSFRRIITVIFIIVLAVSVYLNISDNELMDRYVTDRIFKTADRQLIFNTLIDVYRDNVFGIGNVSFHNLNNTYESYHSSFMKVLIRYGFIGFILFIAILLPRKVFYKIFSKENIPLLFLILVGLFQDMLFHIHTVIMYSIFTGLRNKSLFYRGYKSEN